MTGSSPDSTHLYLVRHGETEWNTQRRYQGHLNSPLTTLGQNQALATGRWLRSRDVPLCRMYSSDLGRASHTASLILGENANALRTDERLRERHMGMLQGLTREEARERFPEDAQAYLGSPQRDFRPRGGESAEEVEVRAAACLRDIAEAHKGESVVVVTHGGVLALLFRHFLGLSLDAPRRFFVRNASIQEFRFTDGEFFLMAWGQTDHLREISS